MTTAPSGNDVLNSSGSAPKSLSWGGIGERVGGRIVSEPRPYHTREYTPGGLGPLKYSDDGSPIWGVSIDVQTNERESADDTGIRRMYVEKPRMIAAIRSAYQSIGADGVHRGGTLFVWQTGTEQAARGSQPANTYAASYTPPGSPMPETRAGLAPAAGQYIPATPSTPQQIAPAPTPTPTAQTRPQLRASVAAAMAAVGADVSAFDIIPD